MIQFLNKHYRRYKVNAIKKAHNITNKSRKDLQSAGNIAILFDATEERAFEIVSDFSDKLRQGGKKVTILGYLPKVKKSDQIPAFSYCTKRDLQTFSDPKNERLARFLKSEFDILIGLFKTPNLRLEHLAYVVNASFKVGHYCSDSFCFDLMLEEGDEFSLKNLALDVNKYLPKITTKSKQVALAIN